MDKISLGVILTPEQIKQAKVVLQSTRYFKYHVVELHGIQFQGSWWGECHDYSASHWKINVDDYNVINVLRMLGFNVSVGLPKGYREVCNSLRKFTYPLTDWVEAVWHFDEYYMYSDSAEVYRNHSQVERIIKSREPTIEECLYIKHILPPEKHHYIPKDRTEQVDDILGCRLWDRVDQNSPIDLDKVIRENQNDFSHLIKPCRFDDE